MQLFLAIHFIEVAYIAQRKVVRELRTYSPSHAILAIFGMAQKR